jgi:hypothetical protein
MVGEDLQQPDPLDDGFAAHYYRFAVGPVGGRQFDTEENARDFDGKLVDVANGAVKRAQDIGYSPGGSLEVFWEARA